MQSADSNAAFLESDEFKKQVRTLQIIVGALCLGVINFLVISLFIAPSTAASRPAPLVPVFTYVGLGMTAMMLLMRVVVRHFFLSSGLRNLARGTWKTASNPILSTVFPIPAAAPLAATATDAEKLCSVFRTRTIFSVAMLEGSAFFMIVTFIMEHRIESVAIAAALLAGIALHFPTTDGLRHWVGDQIQTIEQMRRNGQA